MHQHIMTTQDSPKYEPKTDIIAFRIASIRKIKKGIIISSLPHEGHRVTVSQRQFRFFRKDPKRGQYLVYDQLNNRIECMSAKRFFKLYEAKVSVPNLAELSYEVFRAFNPRARLFKKPYPEATVFFNDEEYAKKAGEWLDAVNSVNP